MPTMKRKFDGTSVWQVIKSFDNSEIHDVFSLSLWCDAKSRILTDIMAALSDTSLLLCAKQLGSGMMRSFSACNL